MTVDDRGEGGGLPYLVRPDDVISGQPLIICLCIEIQSRLLCLKTGCPPLPQQAAAVADDKLRKLCNYSLAKLLISLKF